MIKLKQYCIGIKPKNKTELILVEDVVKTEEDLYVLLIPESIVNDLKKGDIGEWD